MLEKEYTQMGLLPDATDEELKARYEELKAKYSEDRWLEGELGNEAARKLDRLEVAYKEILSSRAEKAKEENAGENGANAFEEISELLKNGDITTAQTRLDEFNERNAEWHYLQAVVFYKKNWSNESKKQLEIAMQLNPDEKKYRVAYQKLNEKTNYEQKSARPENPYERQSTDSEPNEQMGGNGCADCISCCYTYLCIDCLFSLCCGCR